MLVSLSVDLEKIPVRSLDSFKVQTAYGLLWLVIVSIPGKQQVALQKALYPMKPCTLVFFFDIFSATCRSVLRIELLQISIHILFMQRVRLGIKPCAYGVGQLILTAF